jgi:hypothetical protein
VLVPIAAVTLLWAALIGVAVAELTRGSHAVALNAAWLAAAPLIAVLAGLQIYCLIDLSHPGRRVRGRSKPRWAVLLLCSIVLGPIIYLTYGREDS